MAEDQNNLHFKLRSIIVLQMQHPPEKSCKKSCRRLQKSIFSARYY